MGKITISTALDNSGFNSGYSDVQKKLNNLSKNTAKSFDNTLSQIGGTIKKVASIIGIAFGVAAIVNFGKAALQAASEMESAFIGLQSIVEGQGRSFVQAKAFIQDYISDGLIPAKDAVAAYKNLAMRGYGDEQIVQTMERLKDAAAFGRQASLSMGEAVASATEGLKNENSILVDNAGVTKNVSMMWKDYAASIGTTASALTQQQKIQAEVLGIMEETRFQTGDAAKVSETYQGAVTKLGFAFTNFKVAVGNAIMPIAQIVIPIISNLITWFTKLFNAIGSVTQALFGTKSTMKDTASSTGTAATATNKLANATTAAGKAAKKNTASFDELNQLTEATADSAANAADALSENVVGGVSIEQQEPDTSPYSGFVDELMRIFGAYNNWFTTNFGGIFSDIWSKMQPNINTLVKNLSKIWDDIKSLGNPLMTWFSGDFTTYLKTSVTVWGETINGLFESFNIVFADIWNIAINPFLQKFATTILPFFTQVATEIVSTGGTLFNTVKGIFDKIWQEGVAPALTEIMKIWGEMWDSLKAFWDEHGAPIFDGIREAIKITGEVLTAVWDNFLKPVFDKFMETIDWLWVDHIKPFLDVFLDFVGTLVEAALLIYNKVIAPIVKWLVEILGPIFAEVFGGIFEVIGSVFAGIMDVVGGVLKFFTGVIDFFVGVFTGDWNKAWEGIKGIFGGIWDAFYGLVKFPVNLIIDALNFLLRGVGNLLSGIINIVISGINLLLKGILTPINLIIDALNLIPGVEIDNVSLTIPPVPNFGDMIPTIPKLATGAVIPPNKEFMAIMGDQKSGTNIETPEALMRQIVREEMSNASGTSNGNVTIVAEGNTDQIIRFFSFKIKQEQGREATRFSNRAVQP